MTPAATRQSSGKREARLLVVEDNAALRLGIATALRSAFAVVDDEEDGARAVARLADPRTDPYDVIISDLRLPGVDGRAVLEAALARESRTGVILMTAYGSIELAVEAMRVGAFDFLQKPFDLAQLELRIARALEHGRLRGEVDALRSERSKRLSAERVVARSPALTDAIAMAGRVAASRSTVLLTGETGTGKEILAGLIHTRSPRADAPFVKVNCAAMPETLLESELFGHERGAFTGADRRRIGRFEEADGGTLFLDEVGDLSRITQAKLLRVLQDQEFHRLGGSTPLRTDARIVAATNRDLEQAVGEGGFREDLYFRLHVIGIHLPPLRERPEDAEALAAHFLAHFAGELGRPELSLSEAAIARIAAHAWPGNVRELRNAVERAALMADGARIEASDLALSESAAGPSGFRVELPPGGVSLEDVEREVVLAALRRTGFVQKEAAALIGVSRRKLNYMIGRLGLTHPSWRRHRDIGPVEPEKPDSD